MLLTTIFKNGILNLKENADKFSESGKSNAQRRRLHTMRVC